MRVVVYYNSEEFVSGSSGIPSVTVAYRR
jgi:hypothetical protein